MPVLQPNRISYTRRDLQSYHDDVSRFLKAFVPRITETSEANEGRLFLTAFEALVDNANFSVDKAHNESKIRKAKERKNILEHAYLVDYKPGNVSGATADATFSMRSGVAGAGGQAIPIFTQCLTNTSPVLEFLTLAADSIPEGEASVSDVPLVQGTRTVLYSLESSASGLPHQTYKLPVPNTPDSYIEIQVSSVVWERPERNDLFSSSPVDQHYFLTIDDDNFVTVNFGDGVDGDDETFGAIPAPGATIRATFIQCDLTDGNVAAGSIYQIVGALSPTVIVTNPLRASGGADAESNESIVINSAANNRSYERVVTTDDYETHAKLVAGVYDAFAAHTDGAQMDLYILPEGGGVASSTLLQQVADGLAPKIFEGSILTVYALSAANILIQANMVLKTNRVQKSTAKKKAKDAIDEALLYTEIKPGTGFKLSDVSAIFENLDDGTLVEYVDFVTVSRVPVVIKSNGSAPDMVGRVKIFSPVEYKTYLLQAIDTTTYVVSIDGTPEAVQGTVGVEYATSDLSTRFTLGVSTDILTAGDTWRFKTSKFKDNMFLDNFEFMQQELDSDVQVAVFFPKEYDFVTQQAL